MDSIQFADKQLATEMDEANTKFVAKLWDEHFFILKALGAKQLSSRQKFHV